MRTDDEEPVRQLFETGEFFDNKENVLWGCLAAFQTNLFDGTLVKRSMKRGRNDSESREKYRDKRWNTRFYIKTAAPNVPR